MCSNTCNSCQTETSFSQICKTTGLGSNWTPINQHLWIGKQQPGPDNSTRNQRAQICQQLVHLCSFLPFRYNFCLKKRPCPESHPVCTYTQVGSALIHTPPGLRVRAEGSGSAARAGRGAGRCGDPGAGHGRGSPGRLRRRCRAAGDRETGRDSPAAGTRFP